ncbi:protein of unknown function DUF4033, partial [Cynara cardunculus var. scolymus]
MGTAIPSTQATILPFPPPSRRKPPPRSPKGSPPVLAVLTQPAFVTIKNDDDLRLKIDSKNNTIATTSKTVYHDNWFERIAIDYLSKTIQETVGMKNDEPGYKGFVTVSAAVFREFNLTEQRQFVDKALEKAIPSLMFLEEANCIGMCTNLCKMPSQEFMKNNFGIPVNMVPNFDDMSCEMIFGQDPPAQEDDPAFKKPCYKL